MNSSLCAAQRTLLLDTHEALINSSSRAAPSGTHTVLNRSLSVLFVVAHAGRGNGVVSPSAAPGPASSSNGARSPTPARLSVPSARSALVRLPPIAPLRWVPVLVFPGPSVQRDWFVGRTGVLGEMESQFDWRPSSADTPVRLALQLRWNVTCVSPQSRPRNRASCPRNRVFQPEKSRIPNRKVETLKPGEHTRT